MPLEKYPVPSSEAPSSDGGGRLAREAQLLMAGASGFVQAADEARHHPLQTGAKMLGGAALGVGVGLLSRKAGIAGLSARALGAGLGVAFCKDIFANTHSLMGAAADAWTSGNNMERNLALVRKQGGEFLFDTALFTATGLASAKMTQHFQPKVTSRLAEMRDNRQLNRNFDRIDLSAGEGNVFTFRFPKPDMTLKTSLPALQKALDANRASLAGLIETTKPPIDRLALHGTTEANARSIIETKTSKDDLFSSAARPGFNSSAQEAASLEARSAIAFSYAESTPHTIKYQHQKSGPAVLVMEHPRQLLADLHAEKFGREAGSRYYANEPKLWTGTGREGQVEIALESSNFAAVFKGLLTRQELQRFETYHLWEAFSPSKLSPKQYNTRYEAGEPLKIERQRAFGGQYVAMRSLEILNAVRQGTPLSQSPAVVRPGSTAESKI